MISENEINEIKRIARLAYLSQDDPEIAGLYQQLQNILNYVKKLDAVNVSEVEPLSHVHGATNVLREDEITESLTSDDALKNAPDSSGRYFRVPIIIE